MEEAISQPAGGTASAHPLWCNAVIRTSILRHADSRTLSNVLRLNKEAFQDGVKELWMDIPSDCSIWVMLDGLRNLGRYKAYTDAVLHLDSSGDDDPRVVQRLALFPHLRSISFEVICTVGKWNRPRIWQEYVEFVKSKVPEEWTVKLRPRCVILSNADRVERFITSLEKQEIMLPQEVEIGELDRADLRKIMEYATNLSRSQYAANLPRSPMVEHLRVDFCSRVYSEHAPLMLEILSANAWAGVAKSIEFHGIPVGSLELLELLSSGSLSTYRQVTVFLVAPGELGIESGVSAGDDSLPAAFDERLEDGRTRWDTDLKIVYHIPGIRPQHCTPKNLPDAVRLLDLPRLARLLLATIGRRDHHKIMFTKNQYFTDEASTLGLVLAKEWCNFLSAIFEAICASSPRGYHKLQPAERRAGVKVSIDDERP